MGLGVGNQRACQCLPIDYVEAKPNKKLRLTGAFGMVEGKKIIGNLASIDACVF
jgi:hypothetical protein